MRNNDMRMVAELWKLCADANIHNAEGDSPAVLAASCMNERNAGTLTSAGRLGVAHCLDLCL